MTAEPLDRTVFVTESKEKFPFTIEFFDLDGTVVHTIEVAGPGSIQVPGLAKDYGPVGCRTTYADGEIVISPPLGTPGVPEL